VDQEEEVTEDKILNQVFLELQTLEVEEVEDRHQVQVVVEVD
jgi:hypothetical protein